MLEELLPENLESSDKSPNRREFLASISIALLTAKAISGSVIAQTNKNMPSLPTDDNIDFLKKYPTSVLESAIYLLKGTHEGITLTRPGIERFTANAERLVGYAATSVFSTDPDDARGRRENLDYWEYVFNLPGPKIAVSFDSSKELGSGSSWGQQNAHIHKGLGCRGVLTNGGVRDIEVFRGINFQVFSGSLTVGHGNPHFVDFGKPVTLYGATISSGDAICADEHGAIVVPKEFLPDIEEAAAETQRRVNLVKEYSQRTDFTPKGLAEVLKNLRPATPWKPSRR
jgi:regulator of RNase E activity RraA